MVLPIARRLAVSCSGRASVAESTSEEPQCRRIASRSKSRWTETLDALLHLAVATKRRRPVLRNTPKNWDRRCSCILVAVARDALAVASFPVSLEMLPTSPLLVYIQSIAHSDCLCIAIYFPDVFRALSSLATSGQPRWRCSDRPKIPKPFDVNDMTYTGRDKMLARMSRFPDSLAGVRNTSPGRNCGNAVYRICHEYHIPSKWPAYEAGSIRGHVDVDIYCDGCEGMDAVRGVTFVMVVVALASAM